MFFLTKIISSRLQHGLSTYFISYVRKIIDNERQWRRLKYILADYLEKVYVIRRARSDRKSPQLGKNKSEVTSKVMEFEWLACDDNSFRAYKGTKWIMPGNIYNKHPDYESYDHRLDSFNGWAQGDKVQPEELASAGLFYTGTHDFVKCFSCGTGIRNWEHGDDPWIVHAQSLPKCNYVTEVKGSEFIDAHAGQNVGHPNVEEEAEDNAPNSLMPCRVCMNKNSNMVFIPCSHMVTCETCAPEIGQCVVCEAPIIERIRAYMPYMP